MGLDDKMDNLKDKVTGQGKEAAGKATDNEELEAEGKSDQASASVKKTGEDVKDVFR